MTEIGFTNERSRSLASRKPALTEADELRACEKTVAVFSSILRTPYQLQTSKTPTAFVRGDHIFVPKKDKLIYTWVERIIAHLLFAAPEPLRRHYVSLKLNEVTVDLLRKKVKADPARIQDVTRSLVAVLEDHRVKSLWGQIYEGSLPPMRQLGTRMADKFRDDSGSPLIRLIIAYSAECAVPPELAGLANRYGDLIRTALQTVEGAQFDATCVAANKLFDTLRDLLLKEQEQLAGKGDAPSATAGALGLIGTIPDDAQVFYANPADATERTLEQASIEDSIDAALSHSTEEITDLLRKSQIRASEQIQKIRDKLAPPQTRDEWLLTDRKFDIQIQPVWDSDLAPPPVLDVEERLAVRKIQRLFQRLSWHKHYALSETGTEVDPSSYIQARLSKQHVPVLKSERSETKFSALFLLDLSTSMRGSRVKQAALALHILKKALPKRDVTFAIWGFSGPDVGILKVWPFRDDSQSFLLKKHPEGDTPLAAAVDLAVKELSAGEGRRHLFILSDGAPHYALKGADGCDSKPRKPRMIAEVAESVKRARRKNISITAILLGHKEDNGSIVFDVDTSEIKQMFGHPRSWRCLDQERFAEDLTHVVSRSLSLALRT
jgi:uncharacterized protein YegL